MDKTVTNAYYVFDLDRKSSLPRSIKVVILTATRGETESKSKKITGGKHVAFHFDYTLTEFGKPKKPAIPADAQRLLIKG